MANGPFHLNEHRPAASEASAVGPLTGLISADNPIVATSFVHNSNPHIVFKHAMDQKMSHFLSEALDRLATLVAAHWPGRKLRVTASWDPTGTGHHAGSLHYEGRAADITVDDRDPAKLGELAELAVRANFGWVFYEDALHVHASVPKSW